MVTMPSGDGFYKPEEAVFVRITLRNERTIYLRGKLTHSDSTMTEENNSCWSLSTHIPKDP